MKKIPTIFLRDHEKHVLTQEPNPLCDWVFRGEGKATRKWDGTPVMIDALGTAWRRYEVRLGKELPPRGALFIEVDRDVNTGAIIGWVPVSNDPADKYLREAVANWQTADGHGPEPGTYEACGPKIQGNPEKFGRHVLVPHGAMLQVGAPTAFDALRLYLSAYDIEGIVWHHPDDRMAKIKRRDFGLKRGQIEG